MAIAALAACSKIDLIDCSKGVDQVDQVVDFCSQEYGDWVHDVADRTDVRCLPREELGSKAACWAESVDGCTVRLGAPTGNLGEPSTSAKVFAAEDVSVSRLLCHEILAHWREDGLCGDHGPECYGEEVRALEAKCKEGVQ